MAYDDRSEYLRTLRAVHAHQAIFEAEDIVTRAWLAELGAARLDALELVRALRMADAVSKRELRAALRGDDPVVLAEAQQGVDETRRELDDGVSAAQALLARVDEQIERVCRAAVEREARRCDDLARLRTAWRLAYGSAEFVDES